MNIIYRNIINDWVVDFFPIITHTVYIDINYIILY